MGLADVGFKAVVVSAEETRTKLIDNNDLQVLNEDLSLDWQEPEQMKVPVNQRDIILQQEQSNKARLDEAIKNFEELIKAIQYMQDIAIKAKLQDRTVRVPAKKNPTVRDAIRRMFGIDSEIVTYDMFKKCLELRSQLNDEQRRQTYGFSDGKKV